MKLLITLITTIIFRNLTDVLLIAALVNATVFFAVFISLNLKEVLSSPPLNFEISYRACVGLTLVVTLVLCTIRELANLSWIMVLAGMGELYIIGVVYFFAIDKVVNDPDSAATNIHEYMFSRSWIKVPLAFSMRKF